MHAIEVGDFYLACASAIGVVIADHVKRWSGRLLWPPGISQHRSVQSCVKFLLPIQDHAAASSPLSPLGRDAEAREAAAGVLEFYPAFTNRRSSTSRLSINAKLMIEGRKAGLPE